LIEPGLYHLLLQAVDCHPQVALNVAIPATAPRTILMDSGAVIHGQVISAAERGVARVRVYLHRAQDLPESAPHVTTETDLDGRFVARKLDAGTYRISLDHPLATSDQTVSLEAGERVTRSFELGMNNTVRIDVTDAATRTLPFARVQLQGDQSSRVRHTNGQGTAEFHDLPPGRYRVEVSSRDHSKRVADLEIPQFGQLRERLALN
jgi:hypothetical protein